MPIIPNIKQSGGSGDVNINLQGVNDHEKLGSLYGGDADGHYHLTRSEYEKLKSILDGDIPAPPEPDGYDGGFADTDDRDYDSTLDGGYPPKDHVGNIDGGIENVSLEISDGDNSDGGKDMDGGEITI